MITNKQVIIRLFYFICQLRHYSLILQKLAEVLLFLRQIILTGKHTLLKTICHYIYQSYTLFLPKICK